MPGLNGSGSQLTKESRYETRAGLFFFVQRKGPALRTGPSRAMSALEERTRYASTGALEQQGSPAPDSLATNRLLSLILGVTFELF